MSEMSGTADTELARALAGANVPGAYAAALEAGGCGLAALVGVWAAAEDGEKDEGACVGEVRDVTWAAGHRAVFERVKRCPGAGAWAGLEMYPWRVADAVRLARLARVSEASEACGASEVVSEAGEAGEIQTI